MPRTIRDAKLETRAARDRLKPGKKANWKTLVPGEVHLGYRRKLKGEPGSWLLRRYIGNERYRVTPLGLADDFQDSGPGILSFADAQRAAYTLSRAQGAQTRGTMTVGDAIGDYVAWLKANRATGDDAEARANKLILPTLGKTKLADLTTTRITHWLDALAASPALKRTAKDAKQNVASSPVTKDQLRARRATANRLLTVLKAALNRAFESGHIDTDLAWRRVKPFEKVNAARPGYLSVAEATRLINSADAKTGFRDLVHAALLMGARYGELRVLRVRDFHRGKLHIATSKSGKPRDVVLTDEGVTFFEQLTAGRGRDEILLRRLGLPWEKSAQARPMREACARAKITPPIGIHQLRHTYASHAVMNGMPLMVLARNLGHASTKMIEQNYGHLSETYLDAAIREHAPRYGAVEPSNVKPLGARK